MRRPMIAAALALAAGAVAAGAGGAVALDASSATGRDLAVRAADGDLGVLRGVTGNRRAGAAAVPSSEMSPTLGAGDIVLYDREAYRAAAPARGDVVVLRTRPEQAAVCGSTRERFARVVGVPGDLVTLDGFGVTVNGARLEIAGAGRPQVNRAFGPVPPGRVLVLGDNRRGSCDSASWRPPFVSVRAIRGAWRASSTPSAAPPCSGPMAGRTRSRPTRPGARDSMRTSPPDAGPGRSR